MVDPRHVAVRHAGPSEPDGEFRTLAGRAGGVFSILCGMIGLGQALLVSRDHPGVGMVAGAGILGALLGALMLWVPWYRLPRRAALLPVLPGLCLVALDNWVDPNPYLAITYFTLMAVLLATAHRKWIAVQLRLREQDERRFEALLAASADTTVVLDAARTMSYVSPSADRVLCASAAQLAGRSFDEQIGIRVHPDDLAPLDRQLNELFASPGSASTLRFRVRRCSGAWVDVEGTAHNLLDDEVVRGVLLNLRDITERTDLERALTRQAFTDQLTGLPNRTRLRDHTEQALARAAEHGDATALVLIDLDRFKEVNDTLGHHHGDMLLQLVAQRLETLFREEDTVARLGGDEFAVLLPRVSTIEDAVSVVVKLRAALEEPFVVEGLSVDVDASIGLAAYPEHASNPDELLQRADVAMYAAKSAHQDYMIYDASLDQYNPRRLGLLGQMRRALNNQEFVVYYQPKAEASSGRVLGFEALVRWNHPDYGLLSPGEFIPLAETTGLIRQLTMYVVDHALRECQRWTSSGHDLSIAVNVSTRCLLDLNLPADINELLEEYGVPARQLVLEITESAIMSDPNRALEVLNLLDDLGIRLSIDDFGTGYSSMAYLKHLPVHELKVDRSFVTHMRQQQNERMIVRSTVDLAHNLGLQVVAEGVEDAETWQELDLLGCDAVQGYHLARPMDATRLGQWLSERSGSAPASS